MSHVHVHAGVDTSEVEARLEGVGFAGRLGAADASLWGPDAQEEASKRLGFLRLPTESQDLLDLLEGMRFQAVSDGLTRVVLAGMGGSSLAPEVICAGAGLDLITLDTTDPAQVARALDPSLAAETLLVVSSKSGSTLETDSHLRVGLTMLRPDQIVVVTDPGSPFEARARELGVREVILADPEVGGRYSALSAFGLVPSALAGVDVGRLLKDARDVGHEPGLALGAALASAALAGRTHLLLPPLPHHPGLSDWVEQLVAESTGKLGRGVLPVVVGDDEFWPSGPTVQAVAANVVNGVPTHQVSGSLGGLFLTWEVATTVLGWALEINPFDQPDVEAAKIAARALLDGPIADPLPVDEVADYRSLLQAALDAIPDDGYLAVMAYLDRTGEPQLHGLRGALQRVEAQPVTFGWGPRFLHSTGQLHKGGPATGSFLQISADAPEDLPIPDRPWGFATLQRAQAAGDAQVLRDRGRTVTTIHLPAEGREAAIAALVAAAEGLQA